MLKLYELMQICAVLVLFWHHWPVFLGGILLPQYFLLGGKRCFVYIIQKSDDAHSVKY